jgi:HlyD family secretion protein
MKRLFFWLVVVGVLAALPLGYLRLHGAWRGDPASAYRTAAVSRGDIQLEVTSTGTIQPVQSVQVGAFVSGPIQKVYVDFNSRIKKGDVLAEIDPRTYNAAVAREEASLAHTQADLERVKVLLEQAVRDEQRALKLREAKKTFISETEVDQYTADRKSLEAQVKVAQAAVRQAEASLASARTNLEFTVVKSPVDGLVTDRKVDTGQTVASQFQTPVMFVVAPNLEERIYVHASVDEADIGLIRQAEQRKQPVKFTVDAYPDDTFEGTIAQVRLNPTTVQNVVTYTVVVESPNQEMKLLPGMTANLSFQIEQHTGVLRVPNAALRFHPRSEQVRKEDRKIVEGLWEEDPKEEPKEAESPASEKNTESSRFRSRRHVWVLEGELLRAIEVVAGLSDTSFTELLSGDLEQGQELVTGLKTVDDPSSSP